ncbi:MAG: sigma-70 family RNA polymerase sigma factor [Fuerstiella sp.]
MAGNEEYSTVSSATLLKARDGDDEAWRSIWARYSSRVFRQALRFSISTADAEDVTIEVFRKVWQRLDDFSRGQAGQSLGAWINRITQNTALDLLKRRAGQPYELGSQADQLTAPASSDSSGNACPSAVWLALWRALGIVENECSDRAWECFRLVRFARLPHAEIAETLGMSVSNVSTTASRVFQKIREQCILQLEQEDILIDQAGRLVAGTEQSALLPESEA